MVPGQLLQVAVELVHPGQTQQLVPSMAIGAVATIVTIGGRFVGGGSGAKIDTFTGSETVVSPTLSVALAVRA